MNNDRTTIMWANRHTTHRRAVVTQPSLEWQRPGEVAECPAQRPPRTQAISL